MVKRWKPGRVRDGIKKEEIPTTVDVTMEIIKKKGGEGGRAEMTLGQLIFATWNLLALIIQS